MLKISNIEGYTSKKIIDYGKAAEKIAEIKENNKTVGLCHGQFDLLHPGHIKHFESAKKLCDVLVVSITSDRFITQRKGQGRPIFNEKLRGYMIAGIEHVDYVFISDFNLGVEVIKTLKPSFYIKGPDYIDKKDEEIDAEREAIKSVGGEIKYTNDPKFSTTEIIEYISKQINSS